MCVTDRQTPRQLTPELPLCPVQPVPLWEAVFSGPPCGPIIDRVECGPARPFLLVPGGGNASTGRGLPTGV